jgi:hypothetical protein
MASPKEYAYYIVGTQIGIVEKDVNFDNDPNNKDYGPGVERNAWKSPISSVADALKIEYLYSPSYFINETEDVDTQIDTYVSLGGLLKLIDQGDNNYSASPESLSDGSYIVLRKAGKWNGLHKVKEAGTGYITLYTKCSDSATVQQAFEETVDLYYNVDVLNNENDTIDLPVYLSKALVYYVKARLSEDARDLEGKEYYMREFRRMVEKHQSSLVKTGRFMSSGAHAIR